MNTTTTLDAAARRPVPTRPHRPRRPDSGETTVVGPLPLPMAPVALTLPTLFGPITMILESPDDAAPA